MKKENFSKATVFMQFFPPINARVGRQVAQIPAKGILPQHWVGLTPELPSPCSARTLMRIDRFPFSIGSAAKKKKQQQQQKSISFHSIKTIGFFNVYAMPERHPLTIIHNSMYMNEYW